MVMFSFVVKWLMWLGALAGIAFMIAALNHMGENHINAPIYAWINGMSFGEKVVTFIAAPFVGAFGACFTLGIVLAMILEVIWNFLKRLFGM
jgi:hypothetical protein